MKTLTISPDINALKKREYENAIRTTVQTTIRLKHWVGKLLSYMSIRVLLEKVFAATTIVLCNYAIVVEVLLSTPCIVRMFYVVCSVPANLIMGKAVSNLQMISISNDDLMRDVVVVEQSSGGN
uniref:Uncharacterized protein n=1 Tax=Glossina palpalis gambiensis TaxID=67801 RepID=A0A1B0BG64_9MUSC